MSAPQVTLHRDPQQRWGLAHGDALRLLARLPEKSVDAVVTDPPYGIGFHGERWDRPASDAAAFATWTRAWAAGCRRVLKPGGHFVAFGAPRTAHRLTVGVEDAGLEVRDQLVWLYGQGVPKSRRLPGGFGTALKPGYEPILLARAPLTGTLSCTRERFGTGALGIDAARIEQDGEPSRWPANVAFSHARECCQQSCVSRCPLELLDRARPDVRASRFFYAAKASTREREAGCERLPRRAHHVFGASGRSRRRAHNVHPTVKPLGLMRWLVRLVCPEGGMVLDPFAGSGSTAVAAVLEGRGFFGVEREGDYVEIATARLAHWSGETP